MSETQNEEKKQKIIRFIDGQLVIKYTEGEVNDLVDEIELTCHKGENTIILTANTEYYKERDVFETSMQIKVTGNGNPYEPRNLEIKMKYESEGVPWFLTYLQMFENYENDRSIKELFNDIVTDLEDIIKYNLKEE
jgi:hypothetical protein